MALILASASPRRAELLKAAGIEFEIAPVDIDESPRPAERATGYVLRVADDKARAAAARVPGDAFVLAADTVVVAGGLLGKPTDADDARRMLAKLADSIHEVHTGVVLLPGQAGAGQGRVAEAQGEGNARRAGAPAQARVVTTRVRFGPMTPDEIDWYVATGEPEGKAGGYAIQGRASRFIEWIDGSWSNVVGLPVADVYRMLKQAGVIS